MKSIIITILLEIWNQKISIVLTLFSTAVGGGLTWFVSRWYYVRAAKDMEAESKKLRDLHYISLYAMENAGMLELNRNVHGEITGMTANMSANIGGSSSMTAELSAINEV